MGDPGYPEIDYELAHELFAADYEAGTLTWKPRDKKWFLSADGCARWNTANSLKDAGSKSESKGKTYLRVGFLYKLYGVHRVLFLMRTGRWPSEIDHIDGNGLNNRWDNIREVDRTGNMRNAKIRHDNKSGVCGVSFDKKDKKWRAYISDKGKAVFLGLFSELNDAVSVRKAAEVEYGYHSNHGSQR